MKPTEGHIEEIFENYLKSVYSSPISHQQYIEVRRAFYAGAGGCYFFCMTCMNKLSDDDALEAMETLQKELMDMAEETGRVQDN